MLDIRRECDTIYDVVYIVREGSLLKILVTGVKGQLGYDVCAVLAARGIENRGVDIDDFDLTDGQSVRSYLDAYRPDAVIHCAAYTAVDRAEDEPERCAAVNVDGTRHIADACKALDAKMLYVSTDYVFPGTGETPYEADDPTGPLSIYGKTKLAGELLVKELLERYFIVRISWVFGSNGNNFVKTMLRLGAEREVVRVVGDQVGSPTYTADLAPLLCDMITTEKYGVYHATNEGYCSWAEFAGEIFRAAGMDTRVEAIGTAEYPTKAQRPGNSRLGKGSLDGGGFARLAGWRDAVERYVKRPS